MASSAPCATATACVRGATGSTDPSAGCAPLPAADGLGGKAPLGDPGSGAMHELPDVADGHTAAQGAASHHLRWALLTNLFPLCLSGVTSARYTDITRPTALHARVA